jgi:hypothetical protein
MHPITSHMDGLLFIRLVESSYDLVIALVWKA